MSAKPKPAAAGAERRAAPRIEGTGARVCLGGEEGWKSWFFAIALLPSLINKESLLANISTGGFLLNPYDGNLTKGQTFNVTLVFPDGDDMVEFDAEACVARRGPEGLGAYFVNLQPDAKAFLQAYLSKYQSG